MNKILVLMVMVVAFAACNRKPFVKHKLEFQKVADNCSEQQSYFRLNSNFGGERYEFEKCLSPDFKEAQMSTTRQGDTVVVNFPPHPETGGVVFHITIDIDSYPKYNFLTVDDDTYVIGQK